VKLIKVSSSGSFVFAKVDDDDFERVSVYRWKMRGHGGRKVPTRRVRKGTGRLHIKMHREIMSAPPNRDVDHINGDVLDNQKSNLRLATRAQNCRNRHTVKAASGYKGVYKLRSGRWIVKIRRDYKAYGCGTFDSPEEAARAYDAKAVELFGEFACTNFSGRQRCGMSLSKRELENGMEYGEEIEHGGASVPQGIPPVERKPRITNIYDLPEPLVQAVMNDKYSPGHSDYTTSQLAGTPARQWALKRKHWFEITEDVSDRIYSLSGQSKHVVLERAAEFCEQYEYLAEKRFYIQRSGKTVGGQIDLYDKRQGILYDWKETSVYVSYLSLKEEWIAQGNINRLLLIENGYEVNQITNIALYRDWKKSLVGSTEKYPPHQVAKFEIPIWPEGMTESFISSRIAEFEAAKKELPECSDSERWKAPDVWALTKVGGKKALKLFETEAEALSHMEIFNIPGEITLRPGVNKRCQSYCVCLPFCEQAKRLGVKEQDDGTDRNPIAA
jgi:hypothetical protein